MRQILTWDSEIVRVVVVPDRKHNGACLPGPPRSLRVQGRHHEHLLLAFDLDNLLVKRNLERVRVDDATVVPQRLELRRFIVGRHERQAANLEQFRRGEKNHVRRKFEDPVDEDALLDERVVETLLLGGNGGGEAGWPCADDQYVADGHDRCREKTEARTTDELTRAEPAGSTPPSGSGQRRGPRTVPRQWPRRSAIGRVAYRRR